MRNRNLNFLRISGTLKVPFSIKEELSFLFKESIELTTTPKSALKKSTWMGEPLGTPDAVVYKCYFEASGQC